MQYLNQTIVYLSEENKSLREKCIKLEGICTNLIQASRVQLGFQDHKSKMENIQKEVNDGDKSIVENSMSDLDRVVMYSPSKDEETKYEQQIAALKQQLQQIKTLYHKCQLQCISKSSTITQLTSQIFSLRQQLLYTKKDHEVSVSNMKKYYETVLIGQMREKFEQERKQMEKRLTTEFQSINQSNRQVLMEKNRLEARVNELSSQLKEKYERQQRMISLIKQLKTLLQSSQCSYQRDLSLLQQQITQKQNRIISLQSVSEELQSHNHRLQLQVDQLTTEMTKMSKEILIQKREHQRSLSKSQRTILKQRELSQGKACYIERENKLLRSQLKKTKENQIHLRKTQKSLIRKIKDLEQILTKNSHKHQFQGLKNGHSKSNYLNVLNESDSQSNCHYRCQQKQISQEYIEKVNLNPMNNSKNNVLVDTIKNSRNMNPFETKESFSKYLNQTPSTTYTKHNQHQTNELICPHNDFKQSRVSSNSYLNNTPKSRIKLKSNTVQVINRKNSTTSSELPQANRQAPGHTKEMNTCSNVHENKHNRKSNPFVSIFDPSAINTVTQCCQSKESQDHFTLPSEESLSSNFNSNSHNNTLIDLIRNQSTLLHQQFHENNSSINAQVDQLRMLQQYMRTSFNPNHTRPMNMLSPPSSLAYNPSTSSSVKKSDKKSQLANKKQPAVTPFSVVQEQQAHDNRLPKESQIPRQNDIDHELIKKLLKTQQSNQKEQNPFFPNFIANKNNSSEKHYEEIQDLLTMRSSTLIHSKQSSYSNTKTQPLQNNKQHELSLAGKQHPMIAKNRSHLRLQSFGQSNPFNDKLMKISDLDTPCFQSSFKTHNIFSNTQNSQIPQQLLSKQSQNHKNLSYNASPQNSPARNRKKRISININSLNSLQSSRMNVNKVNSIKNQKDSGRVYT